MTKREKCKFGLLKGRSSKFSSTLAFPASFYKGLEEFEADLDPKQIEKLLVFFEVISTQEKISKVSFLPRLLEMKKTTKFIFWAEMVIYNEAWLGWVVVFKLAGRSLRFMKIDWLLLALARFE